MIPSGRAARAPRAFGAAEWALLVASDKHTIGASVRPSPGHGCLLRGSVCAEVVAGLSQHGEYDEIRLPASHPAPGRSPPSQRWRNEKVNHQVTGMRLSGLAAPVLLGRWLRVT